MANKAFFNNRNKGNISQDVTPTNYIPIVDNNNSIQNNDADIIANINSQLNKDRAESSINITSFEDLNKEFSDNTNEDKYDSFSTVNDYAFSSLTSPDLPTQTMQAVQSNKTITTPQFEPMQSVVPNNLTYANNVERVVEEPKVTPKSQYVASVTPPALKEQVNKPVYKNDVYKKENVVNSKLSQEILDITCVNIINQLKEEFTSNIYMDNYVQYLFNSYIEKRETGELFGKLIDEVIESNWEYVQIGDKTKDVLLYIKNN